MALLKSGKKEEAYKYFKTHIETVQKTHNDNNNNNDDDNNNNNNQKLLDLYQALAVTSYANNKLNDAANAYKLCGNNITNTTSKGSLYLQAATLYYKNKDYHNAANAYKLVIQSASNKTTIDNNNMILDQLLSDNNNDNNNNDNNADLILAIAKAGLGASLVAMENYNDAIEQLVEVVQFFETLMIKTLKLDVIDNDFAKVFNNSLSRIQHALNAIESIVDAYLGLDAYMDAINNIKKGTDIITKLLTWTDKEIRKETVKVSEEIKSQIRILKKRKATLLLKQGHAQHNDPNIPVYDPIAYNDELEKIALVWEEAALEFSFLKDYEKSLATYKFVANMWMNAADIKPYHMDLNTNKELADKGYEAWTSVAKEATLFEEVKIEAKEEKVVILKIRKQIIMALYHAAISALYFNNDVARYSFELCKSSAGKYKIILEEMIKVDNKNSFEVEQFDFTIFIGDLSYHLAYAYFRERNFEYANAEIESSISFFISAQDRKKQKRALGLAALTKSGQGLFEDAEQCILSIKNLCLPPIEDPEEEVRELAKIIESEKSSAGKTDITKFPIFPSSTSKYKLETNKITWISMIYNNMKVSNIFYKTNGNLDIIMICSAVVFIISSCYLLYPKVISLGNNIKSDL